MSKPVVVTAKPVVTAAMVRSFFLDEKQGAARVKRFGLADDKSIRKGARGRLSPEAIKGYNKGKPEARHYVSGQTGVAAAAAKSNAVALRKAAEAKGLSVGARGPLSKEARSALGMKPAKKARVSKG